MGCVIKYKGQSIPEEQFLQYLNKQITINNLFNENKTLANEVYEALGFKQNNVEEFQGFWNREQVAAQTDKVFLFGDNTNDRTVTEYVPSMTQAVIRGLPNAIGIDTKKDRGTSASSYLTDKDFEWFKNHIDTQIQKAKNSSKTIVIPADGIGTGKAMLKEKAPKLFEYLQQELNKLKQQITPQQKQKAQQLYSSYLDTIFPDSKVEEIDNSLYISVLNQLEQENKIEKDCTGGIKAEKGLQTNFIKGGKWRVIKDLKGYPTHKEGGVDLTISKDGVSIKNGNTQFIAKHGLVIPKN